MKDRIPEYYVQIYQHTYGNRSAIKASGNCICLYCQQHCSSASIEDFTSDNCAICPRCGVDAMLGDASGIPFFDPRINYLSDYLFKPVDVTTIEKAAELIEQADCLLIGAGAGMSVDSGLPSFRDEQGLWKSYPALKDKKLKFSTVANSQLFQSNPEFAWWFYGHRFNEYKRKDPHIGYRILLNLIKSKQHPSFVYTSNVDGHFQKAGFSENHIVECHGSIFNNQCTKNCQQKIWSAQDSNYQLDNRNCKAEQSLPLCLDCGAVARPNLLMFNDRKWQPSIFNEQYQRFVGWQQQTNHLNVVAIEIGAGMAIPTIRGICEGYEEHIRINRVNDTELEAETILIEDTALNALLRINQLL